MCSSDLMGHKDNPISDRLGIIRGWDSNLYGGKNYGDSLLEDSKIRKYLNARLAKASVSRIDVYKRQSKSRSVVSLSLLPLPPLVGNMPVILIKSI